MSEHDSGILRSGSKCESRILTPNVCQNAPRSFKLITGETGMLSWSSSSPSRLPMTLGVQPTVSASCSTVQNGSFSWKSKLVAQCHGKHGSSSAAGSQCKSLDKVSTGSQVPIMPKELLSNKPGLAGATNALPSHLNTSISALPSRTRFCESNTEGGGLTSSVACSFDSAPAASKREKAVRDGQLMSAYVPTSRSSNGVCSVQVELEPSSDGNVSDLRTVGSPLRCVNASDKEKDLMIVASDAGSCKPVQNESLVSFLSPSQGRVGESNPANGNAHCKATVLPASVASYLHTNSTVAVNTTHCQPVLLPALDRGMLTIKVASSVMPMQQRSQSALFFVAPATTLQKVLLGDRGQASIVSVLPSPAGQASMNANSNFLVQPGVTVNPSTAHVLTQNKVESSASSGPVVFSCGFECQTKHLNSKECSSMLSNVTLKDVSQVHDKGKIIALENAGLSSCSCTVTQTVKEKSAFDRYVKSSFMLAAKKAFNKIRLSDTLISEESDQRTLPTIVGYRSLVQCGSPSVVNASIAEVAQGPLNVPTPSNDEHGTSFTGVRLSAPSKSVNVCSSISDPLLAGENCRSLAGSSDKLHENHSEESVSPSEDTGLLTEIQNASASQSLLNNRECHDASEPVKVQMSALHVAGGGDATAFLNEISSATKSSMFVRTQQSLTHAYNPAPLTHGREAKKCKLQQVVNTPSSMHSISKQNPWKHVASPATASRKSRLSKSSESKRGNETLALEDRVKSLRALQSILLAEKKKQKAFVRKMYEKYVTAAGPVTCSAVASQVAAVKDESNRKQDSSGRANGESSKIKRDISFVSEACSGGDRGVGSNHRGNRDVLGPCKLDSLGASQSNAVKSLKEVIDDPPYSRQPIKGGKEKFSFSETSSEIAKVSWRDDSLVASPATERPMSRSSSAATAVDRRNVPAKVEDAKLLKKVEPDLCSLAAMDQNCKFQTDGNELDKACVEVFKRPKSVTKDGMQSSGKRRSRELECLVDEHWNESWLKQEQKMRRQSKEKLSHVGTETCDVSVRENRALTYALARFAEMEQERRSAGPVAPSTSPNSEAAGARYRKGEEVASMKSSNGEDVRGKKADVGESEPGVSRTSSVVLKRSRENVVAPAEGNRNSKKRRHGWQQRQQTQKQAQRLVRKARTATKVWKDQKALAGFQATADIIKRSIPSCPAVRTTNVVVKRLSEAEIAKASKAYRKEFLLVPKYRGFLDFSPVVVESRTRGQRTSEDEVKLKKPEYPVLVVEGSNVDGKDLLVNQNEESAGDPSTGKKCSLSVNRTAGETILHKAARLGKVDLLEEQIRQGLDVNAVDNAGWSPLHEACAAGWENIVKLLLQYGANPNCSSDSGVRPIHDAVQSGNLAVVRLLLMYGADARSIISSGGLPQHLTRNEKLHQFLEDFCVDQQVTDLPVDVKDFRKGKWQFTGSSSTSDVNEDARTLLEGAPSNSADPDVASFQLSQCEYPMSFYLPCLKDRTIVGHRNYFYVPDLLKRLGMSREVFLRQHKAGIRLEPWSTFQACVSSSQLSPLITHEMFDSQPFIELVCISNSAMAKLLSVTNLSV